MVDQSQIQEAQRCSYLSSSDKLCSRHEEDLHCEVLNKWKEDIVLVLQCNVIGPPPAVAGSNQSVNSLFHLHSAVFSPAFFKELAGQLSSHFDATAHCQLYG